MKSKFDLGPKPMNKVKNLNYPKDEKEVSEESVNLIDFKNKYLEVGTVYKVTFSGYTHEGLAIGKVDCEDRNGTTYTNFPIFVFGGIIDEVALVQITRLTKTYAYGEIYRLFKEYKSPDRVQPVCPKFGECGGCDLMHLSYAGQLKAKHEIVKNSLERIGGFHNIKIDKPIGMSGNGLYYRNKVQVPVVGFSDKTLCGFYKRGSHYVIPLDKCYIQSDKTTEIIKYVKNILGEHGVKGYSEQHKTGILRHILVRKNHDEKEIMIVLVVTKKEFITKENLEKVINKVTLRYPNVTSIIGNINDIPGNVILGDKCFKIYGKEYIKDELCGLKFKIGAKSFYQVNHEQCEKLYNIAIDKANLSKDDIIIDAYSGIGTIGLIASKHVNKVYGVEIIPEAVKNANDNAKLNKIDNATFVCAKAEDKIIEWMKEEIKPSTIFVDPPRKGCDKKFIDTIIEMKINKVVYISCDPGTLARDLRILHDGGYVINSITPVDMFSQTHHVECVVSLSRK